MGWIDRLLVLALGWLFTFVGVWALVGDEFYLMVAFLFTGLFILAAGVFGEW